MPDIFLYVSREKVRSLSDQKPGFLANVTAKLNFKLPFVSGGLSGKVTPNSVTDLKRLIPVLNREYDIPPFGDVLKTAAPVFVSFQGQAVRVVEDEHFWLAMESGKVALLLAGSSSNTIGAAPPKSDRLSPSADPIGSFSRAFNRLGGDDDPSGLGDNLSYVWQELMRDALDEQILLPSVEGIAIFGARLKAAEGQMRRIGRAAIKSIVVGTPLYVRQVTGPQLC